MRKILFAMVMSTGAVACAEVVNAPPPELEGMLADEGTTPRQCAMLPADGSACAHACDPAALEAFIPDGTCVIFDCPLTDGTTVRAGGCKP